MQVPSHLHIFGDGSLRGQLQGQAVRLGVEATFHGYVDDVRSRLRELDIFVLPTRGDNLPIAILEAMAEAIPVVATRVGGIPELVADRHTGLLVEPDDVNALAIALNELSSDESLRVTCGRNGALRIQSEFNAGQEGMKMVQLYRSLCGSST
jgi:glycosyltransferase involved in cell wall biosynthesis